MKPDLRPMLASLIDAPLEDPRLVYEPKYDGIRAVAEVARAGSVRLWSRLGNEKSGQFPEIVGALQKWARRLKAPVVLDGEIVALDEQGEPTGFQRLQRKGTGIFSTGTENIPVPFFSVAFVAFDVLREGRTDFRERPLLERRQALERIFGQTRSPLLRVSEMVRADGRALYKRALERGWEGLIAKHADSHYKSGKRTPDWRKLKIVHEQEFVVGGWTEPRHTRTYFGALLLGVYGQAPAARANETTSRAARTAEAGAPPKVTNDLVYAGHAGTGFNERELARVMKLLRPLETKECPFRERPRTNERPHWVRPELVAQIKFIEWTADAKLRHPVYLGLRDDKKAEGVVREPDTRLHATTKVRFEGAEPGTQNLKRHVPIDDTSAIIDQLRTIESSRRDGVILLPDGDRLNVSNLHKVFWPKQKLTKGDLMRYYVQVAPFILPAVDGRPLVMKRFPNGIAGKAFYQQRAPDEVPEGVRVAVVGDLAEPNRIIGGNLKTLLYMSQLAAISQDPWFSRVTSPESADHVALDLDPMPDVSFARVLDVARWIRDELESIGATGVPKTSGADGLHIYIPLPAGTPYDAGLIFCQIIATLVVHKHPKVATIARAVGARGACVYVDYLQNIPGKTLATAYSARASEYAGVSTPLSWREIDEGVKREQFTIETAPARIREVGDLWAVLRKAKGVDLSRVARYVKDG